MPLWRSLLIAATGPVVAAVLAGFALNVVASKAQERRERLMTKERLAHEMTESATTLYMATQRFWRLAGRPLTAEARFAALETTPSDKLDDAYTEARVRSLVLEADLRRRYGDAVAGAWHQVDDLLTVRYFQLTARDSASLSSIYQKNEGDGHTRLSKAELADVPLLLKTFREALPDVASQIMAAEPSRRGRLPR